jgi:peptide deformylase
MSLEILKNNNLLFKKTETFDFNNPPFNIENFSVELCQLMWKEIALGLSANQVGNNYRIFSMIGEPESFVCVNPKILHTFEETVKLEETCLSLPGLVFDVTRPKSLRFRFQGPNSEFFTRTYTGMTARIVQQMVDQLDGIPLWDNLSRLKFDMAIKKAQKLGFDYSGLKFKPKSSTIISN